MHDSHSSGGFSLCIQFVHQLISARPYYGTQVPIGSQNKETEKKNMQIMQQEILKITPILC
jgi:hypothetical protein